MKPLSLAKLAVAAAFLSLVGWSLLDEPTSQNKQLADSVAGYFAMELGGLPELSLEKPVEGGRSYAHHAATGNVVVLALYGFRTEEDVQKAREAARRSFEKFPSLAAISLVFYTQMPFWSLADGSFSHGKALFVSRELINRPH
ncbi:hypothetical protein [Ferriphaselus amnicola]|nr:hypothetical protein [Ferriphaselus amnicola]